MNYQSLNSFATSIPSTAWDTLSVAFTASGCGSSIVTPYDGTEALFEASKTNGVVFDLVSSIGVIYIKCQQDIQIAQQWITSNYDTTKISIRSGGHSFGGYNKANDAIIVDLSNLKSISVIDSEIVGVEPGVTSQDWITYISDNQGSFNRSVPHGTGPTVAFGGLTLGGGISLNMREYGLLIDNLIGFKILLCDNTLLTIIDPQYEGQSGLSTTSNITNKQRDDLLFAVRGSGGSNFGIVTQFYFKTFDITRKQLFFSLHYPINDTSDLISNILKTWRDIFKPSSNPPNNIEMYIYLRIVFEQFPLVNLQQYPKTYLIDVEGVYHADLSDPNNLQPGHDILNLFKTNVGTNYDPNDSILSDSDTISYTQYHQRILDEHGAIEIPPFTDGRTSVFTSSRFVDTYDDLTDEFIEAFAQQSYNNIISEFNQYVKALELGTFDINQFTPLFWIWETMGGKASSGTSTGKCQTNTAFTGRTAVANIVMNFGWFPGAEQAKIRAYNNRAFYESTFLNQLSNKKYINYIDDATTDYDQFYFDECIFEELIRIKNEYNQQHCYEYAWSIPLENPYDGNNECPTELTVSDRSDIEQIVAGNDLFIDMFFNEKDPDNNYIDLVTFIENFYENDAKIINNGFPSDYILINRDSLINWALDTNEIIEVQHQFPTLLYFEDFTSKQSDVNEYNGCINTVTVKQTFDINLKFKEQTNPNVWNNIIAEFKGRFIRRSSDNEQKWLISSNEFTVKQIGVIPSEDDLAPNKPTTTADGLECSNPGNDTSREDIISEMISKGYEVEFGEITFTNDLVQSSILQVPFLNRDGDYGMSRFFSNGQVTQRMGGQDIILFRGCTPPKVTYYSYRSYLLVRVTNNIPLTFEVKQSSLGDSTNNQVIKTESCIECAGIRHQDSFDTLTNIATTGDLQSFNDIKDAYEAVGLSSDLLNLDSIPSEANFIWSEDVEVVPRDTVSIVLRVVNNGNVRDENEALLREYQNISLPIYIFRKVNATNPRIPINAELRKTKVPYLTSENTFFNRIKFENAVRATKEYFIYDKNYQLISDTKFKQKSGIVTGSDGVERGVYIFDHGLKCIEDETNCIVDNRDTHYSWDSNTYTLDNDDLYIIIGLNHNNFDMTTYNSFGIYYIVDPINPALTFTPLQEPDGSIIDDEYEQFDINNIIPYRINKFKNTFISSISRPQNCLRDIMASLCPDTNKLSENEPFVFLARAHLNPRTGTMPNGKQLVPWRLLRFRKK